MPPWTDPGWLPAAERWLRASLGDLGIAVTGPTRQIRVWELSCVLRTATSVGDVYLKAAVDSPLFVNEAAITRMLAGLFPEHVPTPLAVDEERHWLLLPDFGGEVGWQAPTEVREDALRTFARIQVKTAARVDRLLGAGCVDRRLDRLAAEAEAWLTGIEAASPPPACDSATWLSADEAAELRAAVPRITAMCAELAAYEIPTSLVHGDLHLSNVASGPRGYLFFDWTDACVAHPFIDAITFLRWDGEPRRSLLRDAYLSEWTAFEPAERLRAAWRLIEPLGALHHAISYRSIVTNLEPPIERHMAESTASWLRGVLASLRLAGE